MKQFTIIAAHDNMQGIGKNNDIPWYIPSDFRWFKQITLNSIVIMGRKTWESLPIKPLPNRINIIITTQDILPSANEYYARNLDHALELAYQHDTRVFVIGGQSIYEQALDRPDCMSLYITEVNEIFDCDRYFPEYKDKYYCSMDMSGVQFDNHTYKILEYSKK